MRLWSIHPCYLDSKGLVALWREGLLAQNVLLGKTNGYKNHPQLTRFKNTDDPISAISNYLQHVVLEADKRNYKFNKSKIVESSQCKCINVTERQLEYEFEHLLSKLKVRNPALFNKIKFTKNIMPHQLFSKIEGEIEEWEVIHT